MSKIFLLNALMRVHKMMNFKFDQICSGTKTIHTSCGDQKITYSICVYGEILQGNICLTNMPEIKSESHLTIGDSSAIDLSEEMLWWLERDMIQSIEELNDEMSA